MRDEGLAKEAEVEEIAELERVKTSSKNEQAEQPLT